ncbi:MAG: SRPBCC domain-containing protein [Melioribacteraceae bacterium]|nr:SRPBCC domain-containing protein [Melioribacteraceae bacterium]MCF8356855.1 SRPBCC domain-containing protein [Melioribacteraceae bacterium]MCF8396234.1 SRPBCC domain-containing protein [Melioribacteraceae bacterium]MCF8421160.1 SRPBCC domain-containing protein [Melioribacteraceae bacterium]
MKEIYICLNIKAPLNKIYWAVTEEQGLAGWWTTDLDVKNNVGEISIFRFTSGAFNKMRIKNLSENKVEWICVDGHEEWIGTKISFELRSDGGETKVCFSHYNWKSQSEYAGECCFHWAYYLDSLKKLCETGHGLPNS